MWSAVCSRTNTAGHPPGAKMTRGGAIPTSRAPIPAPSASEQIVRHKHQSLTDVLQSG